MDADLVRTPFHPMAVAFLLAGLVLGGYNGLAAVELVPLAGWVSWSHIHFVTIGAFTQLVVGMLPQLTARRLGRPRPSRRYVWANFALLNGGFLLLWYGRGWGAVWAFDAGLVAIWLLIAGMLVVLVGMVRRRERSVDATVWLYLLSPFVFLWGISFAYGLYGHGWSVPGGWLGLREAHVHANAWGFLAFVVIGTLSARFPQLAEADRRAEPLARRAVPLFALGILPLMLGPLLGLGRTLTAAGLVLYALGYVLYLYALGRTYLAGSRSALARWVLVAQLWILGPAGFAPFVLFGVEWVDPAFIEDAALHLFFVGWALPVILAGLLMAATNLRPTGSLVVPDGDGGAIRRWMGWTWHLAVIVVAVGFLYQDLAWSAAVLGVGWTVIGALWLYLLVRIVRQGLAPAPVVPGGS